MLRPATRLALVLFTVSLATSAARADDVDDLLRDVRTIAAPGLPGTVAAWGEHAFVVVDMPTEGNVRQALVAAASFGKGRVVLLGHDGYLNPAALAEADTTPLLLNLIRWASADRKQPRVAVIGLPKVADVLKGKGADTIALARDGWGPKLAGATIAIFPAGTPSDDAEIAALRKFIDGGGAAILAQTGWGWAQTHPGKTLADDLPANRLLAPMGLAFGDGMLDRDKRGGAALQVAAPSPMLNARAALELLASARAADANLLRDKTNDLAQAAATLTHACRAFPSDAPVMTDLRQAAGDASKLPLPSPAKPLRQADGLARVMLTVQLRELARTPIDQLKPHPAAAAFPGAVPAAAQRVTRTIDVDLAVPRWHSTALYAAPGQLITVTLPADATSKGLRLRIGPHTDRTYPLAAWRRAPEISRVFNLDHATTRAGNPFGGLIYVDVPDGSAAAGTLKVTLADAVPAPLFVLGKTPVKAWRDSIRSAPAPWAELATDKLIITLKSDAVRELDDPTAVLEHWDRVMDACATLAARPTARRSPERIVSDADISVGYMHAGYPIMTGLDVTRTFVDLAKLHTLDGGWGFYHEIGHNHQNPDWTFGGTTEVTVNLFSMYVLETVCGLPKEQSTKRALVDPARRIAKYLATPSFDAWKADPFHALAMYAQLRNEFGWEPYKKVFAEYRDLPAAERPRGDDARHDQWMMRMSRAVGRNLGPFFQAWGVPTSDAARRSIADLPAWMPDGMKR